MPRRTLRRRIEAMLLSSWKAARGVRPIAEPIYVSVAALCFSIIVVFSIGPYAFAAFATFIAASSPVVPKIHLLSVGVNHYYDTSIDLLQFAKADAERVQAAFQGLVPRANIVSKVILTDNLATREKILSTARDTALSLGDNDLLIVYFAGREIVWHQDAFLLAVDTYAPPPLIST